MPYNHFAYFSVLNSRDSTFAEKMQAHAERLSWLAESIDRKRRQRTLDESHDRMYEIAERIDLSRSRRER